jgi:hypothetical protein
MIGHSLKKVKKYIDGVHRVMGRSVVGRSNIRRTLLSYLREFYSDFMLYKDKPILNKIHQRVWAQDMYEQLSDKQRLALYLKLMKKNLD